VVTGIFNGHHLSTRTMALLSTLSLVEFSPGKLNGRLKSSQSLSLKTQAPSVKKLWRCWIIDVSQTCGSPSRVKAMACYCNASSCFGVIFGSSVISDSTTTATYWKLYHGSHSYI
jgi:hypothetical protein